MELEDYLAVPYVLAFETVQLPDGRWVRRAEYPELPGCYADAESTVEALDRLEVEQVRYLQERLARGEPIPVPRPPLPGRALGAQRLAFARWLVKEGKLSEQLAES